MNKGYKVMDDSKIAQSGEEKSNIISFVNQTKDIEGDIAEVGVYEGGTASLIYSVMNQDKNIFLFDTFDTFVGAGANDPGWILPAITGPQTIAYPSIVEHFMPYQNVAVIKGDFPAVIGNTFNNKKFSFVHLDVDIYLPTLNSLKFFYPRLSKGGVILLHDYFHQDLRGVKIACDEFFVDKPEKVISNPVTGSMSQGYIIKQ